MVLAELSFSSNRKLGLKAIGAKFHAWNTSSMNRENIEVYYKAGSNVSIKTTSSAADGFGIHSVVATINENNYKYWHVHLGQVDTLSNGDSCVNIGCLNPIQSCNVAFSRRSCGCDMSCSVSFGSIRPGQVKTKCLGGILKRSGGITGLDMCPR